ncbi:hypothetical protein G6O67_005202 [Ophiocordyceps sinensis]|uniref:Uncharacterized protein n=1 Tax=Ophiocordyceps sinensis TaxID=72228 RepID=A0A8H4PR41_9HYPO|nr:hypothetical protein G6O67_005202 [Ophiocordyceps sinensis]
MTGPLSTAHGSESLATIRVHVASRYSKLQPPHLAANGSRHGRRCAPVDCRCATPGPVSPGSSIGHVSQACKEPEAQAIFHLLHPFPEIMSFK